MLRHKKYYKTTRYGYARGNEAVVYVENIRRYYDTLVWLDENPFPTSKQGSEIADSEAREQSDSVVNN